MMSDEKSEAGTDAGKDERHAKRMARKKAVVDESISAAQEERGVFVINTGNGKGKSSAAFGVVARAIGQIPEATEVHSVTGPYDLVVKVQVEEYELMAEVITEKLGPIDGVVDTETLMAFRTYKF